jgi:hypothetical protein
MTRERNDIRAYWIGPKSQVCSAHTIHRKDKDYYVSHDVVNPVFFH